ncbi:universal stress protein [Streptomyces sp. NBC_00838]|uniref:universal stress protein n=1 Tax=Streptomyces sp. NBC_00838 TaxID=2903680 RepID=UPI0038643E26|nr:universal stress protein [Streptomyces sp. NBC_00838]
MTRPVTVGMNNTAGSVLAARWGAQEASLRDAPLRLVSAWEWQPYARASLASNEMAEQWSRRVPVETAAELRRQYPGLDITTERLTGPPPEMLCRAAAESGLLVIGVGGLGTHAGFLGGSVASATVSVTERPVVLIGSGRGAAERGEYEGGERGDDVSGTKDPGPVVVGVDPGRPNEEALGFAFEAASLRSVRLDVIHGRHRPARSAHGPEADQVRRAAEPGRDEELLRGTLAPWSERYPAVAVREHPPGGKPARELADAGAGASLVVLGLEARRRRRSVARVGHMNHAVLHRCSAPVAVVPER